MALTLAFNTSALLISTAVVGFILVSILLIGLILLQKPQGGGLAGAFGSGAGSGQTAFGAKTGDALTIATISLFVFFTLGAIGMNYVIRPSKTVETPAVQSPPGAPQTPSTGAADQPSTPFTTAPGPTTTAPVTPGATPAPTLTPEPVAPAPAPASTPAPAPAPTPAAEPSATPPATTPEKPAAPGGN